ncbi:hypothetical protein Acr_14g0001940 [Actinidia rufa]|uniref:Transposase (putative) gypsy type domain-containing protein n=1 Tax=Actinidia rufa TaxID=165716 RepID=A0A7J0FPB9_9ERIC|nr:hypothetical protein Acr_14g0001940 [Actinidia rufa]
MGVQTRIPRKGEMVLSASSGEVAFYEAAFPAGLGFPVHRTIKQILNFYGICPAQLSPNAWRNIIYVLVIWRFHRCHLSLNEFRGLPATLRDGRRDFFFISGYDWEFHPTIPSEEGVVRVLRSWGAPGKQCNKVPVLSPTKEERFCQVFEKIRGGHFKILVILTSSTFYKYFALGRVEVSSSGGGAVEGDTGGKAAGDIKEAAALMGPTSESSCSTSVSRLDVPSRGDSIEFVGTIGDGMRIPLHASNLAISRRIKLNELAKVAAQKAATPSSKGVIISEGSEMASKKRAPNDGSKGKEVTPPLEVKKTKTGMLPRPRRFWPGDTPADKEKVEKLTFDQVVTKFLHVLGQLANIYPNLGIDLEDIEMDQDFLAQEEIEAERRAAEDEGAGEAGLEGKGD